jgi:hypothetical protein
MKPTLSLLFSSSFSLAQAFFLVLRPLKGWNYQYWHEPSELANLSSKFEVQTLAASINVSNNSWILQTLRR